MNLRRFSMLSQKMNGIIPDGLYISQITSRNPWHRNIIALVGILSVRGWIALGVRAGERMVSLWQEGRCRSSDGQIAKMVYGCGRESKKPERPTIENIQTMGGWCGRRHGIE